MSFASKYGPWALVTGAARGLGEEFALQLAGRGLDLLLLDVLAEQLQTTAAAVRAKTGRNVLTLDADLSSESLLDDIAAPTEDLEIGLLVSNATFGPVGLFFERPLEEKLTAVAVNVRAPLMLAHFFGAKMLARRRGGIIMLSSGSAQQGTPYVANYAATKAYNRILAESLWEELRRDGIDVLAVMPGIVSTPGYRSSNARPEAESRMYVMSAAEVVTETLDALGHGPDLIPGARNRFAAFLTGRLMGRTKAIKLVGKTMRALYETKPDPEK